MAASNMTRDEQRELLRRAIARSGLSARRFARDQLDVDERTVRYWLAGDRELSGPARIICQRILNQC